jgi:tripartite-type tricarboxylate transporter receptor subunit TctC
MTLPIRNAALPVAMLLAASPGMAEVTPDCRAMTEGQPLSIIVANGPGGGYDTYARSMAPSFEALAGMRARVENLPAAGGLVAFRRLVTADPDEWVVLVDQARDIITGMQDPVLPEGAAQGYRLVAIFHLEPSAWITRPGFDPVNPPGGRLVVGTSQGDDSEEMLATANAMSMPLTVIGGYDGSSKISLGVLAGEADLMSASLGTARRLTKAGDLAVAAVLSDGPWPEASDLPYLMGEGGVLERRLAALPGADADRARMLGKLIVGLSTVSRVLAAPAAMPADRAACLDAVIEAVLADPAFHAAAEAEGRPLTRLPTAEGDRALADLQAAIEGFAAVAPTLAPLD